ncbi:PREDICTED: acyl-CoA-binding domain-containing protein 4-like [Acropora digitifera]|uniref:acyl-CoA-binding domain-containing protein 4-like n=1 Tax=Acropora digitifera TaxID=70779 RepID=UPI00077A4822|nr:PREDICTED: acyl-CoA-binding domain-containing protein 4-like [Acropora digitifera]
MLFNRDCLIDVAVRSRALAVILLRLENNNNNNDIIIIFFYIKVPSCRWGHDMCLIGNRKSVLVGGQGSKLQMAKDSIWTLDMSQGCATWIQETYESGGADRRIGHTVTYDPDKKVLYVYGGSKNKRWFNDVNVLDLQENTWTAVKALGSAPTRAYHSCNFFKGELLVFGGVYPNPDPQPDSCSNELFIFNADAKNWYKPLTTGTPPCPKSGHSASLIEDRLVLFGGWDFPQCFNDVSIIDLAMMEFSSPVMTGCLPSPRSWHASAVLPKQRIFIHGGYDGNQILTDSFIFDLALLTCTAVKTSNKLRLLQETLKTLNNKSFILLNVLRQNMQCQR